MWSTDAFDNLISNQMILDQNKGSFDWWVNPPINPWFKVYIWNYTNWDEYLSDPSIKIKLQEVGPFTFKEVIRRENISFDEHGITLAYKEVKSYEFTPELSGADMNATVVVPSFPFFAVHAKLSEFPQLFPTFGLPVLNSWFNAISNIPQKQFQQFTHVHVSAHDFIWGYKDKILEFIKYLPNQDVPDHIGLLLKEPEDMMILTGSSDIDQLSYVVRFKGNESLSAWPDPSCNKLHGSDGSMFPPKTVHAKDPVYAFKAEACRMIKFVFEEHSFAQGVPTYRYILDRSTFMSPRTHPENLCYCNLTNLDDCAPDGLFDTSPCTQGTPTLISYPHFYLTDDKVKEPFEGLNPNKEDHDMFADIHPRFGMTLQGRSRLQINVRFRQDLPPLKKGLVLPVAWFAQDLPSYERGFKAMLIAATYGVDIVELALLYVLPVVATITAIAIVRRLLADLGRKRETQPAIELVSSWKT